MTRFRRYGVYYVPEGPLARFGAEWLGWDIARAIPVEQPDLPGLDLPLAEITARPRRYGFHATLKPPFRLAPSATEHALDAAVAALARRTAPVRTDPLAPGRLGRFLALLPQGDATALNGLAAHCVRELDTFRAPPGPEELARRTAGRLSAEQLALLQRWGYPHVMGQFRFHMTLTGPVDDETASALETLLADRLPDPGDDFGIDAIALVGEDEDGFFRLIRQHPLTG